HGRGLGATGGGAEHRPDLRARRRRLHVAGNAEAAAATASARLLLALREPRRVDHLKRLGQALAMAAALDLGAEYRGVRMLLAGDHVAAADLGAVEAELFGGHVDQ